MENEYPLLSFEEAAAKIGVEPRKIKQLIRDHRLFTLVGSDGKKGIPREIITKSEQGWEPLWNLSGTLTLLSDAGFTLEEATQWLYEPHPELGESPLKALLNGRHHRVNAIASVLAF